MSNLTNMVMTVAIFLLVAILVGLLGAAIGNPRRARIERIGWKLAGLLLVLCPLVLGLLLAEHAPANLGARLDTMLQQPHFGMTSSDMLMAALKASMIVLLAWETVRRWHDIPKPVARSMLLVGLLFSNLGRDGLGNPLLLELEFTLLAALTIFAGRFAWLTWLRPDGGVSA